MSVVVSGQQHMIDQAAVMRKTWARGDVTPLLVLRSEGSQWLGALENRCWKVASDSAALLCAFVHTLVGNGFGAGLRVSVGGH